MFEIEIETTASGQGHEMLVEFKSVPGAPEMCQIEFSELQGDTDA